MEFIIETEIECGSAVDLYSKDLIQNQLWSQGYVCIWLSSSIHSVCSLLYLLAQNLTQTQKEKKISKSPQILFIKIISILLEVSGSLYFQLE